jgi:hypothetical protein
MDLSDQQQAPVVPRAEGFGGQAVNDLSRPIGGASPRTPEDAVGGTAAWTVHSPKDKLSVMPRTAIAKN